MFNTVSYIRGGGGSSSTPPSTPQTALTALIYADLPPESIVEDAISYVTVGNATNPKGIYKGTGTSAVLLLAFLDDTLNLGNVEFFANLEVGAVNSTDAISYVEEDDTSDPINSSGIYKRINGVWELQLEVASDDPLVGDEMLEQSAIDAIIIPD